MTTSENELGLGECEGELAMGNFSSNVGDLFAAAQTEPRAPASGSATTLTHWRSRL